MELQLCPFNSDATRNTTPRLIQSTSYLNQVVAINHLVINAGGSVAEDALVKNGKDAATGTLADSSTGGAKVVGVGNGSRGVSAVEIGNTENIGGTALSGSVETGAGNIGHLAFRHLRRESHGDAGEGGEGGNGELHFEGVEMIWASRSCDGTSWTVS